MSQYNYTTKPNWYPAGQISATSKGWTLTATGEVLVALGNLDTINADAAVAPTFTAAVTYSGTAAMVTGNVITVTLTASEGVNVQNTPKIALTVGANTRQLVYDANTSTATSLAFKYTVVAGDSALAGGVVVAGATNAGYISDVLPKGKQKLATVTFVAPVTSTATAN